MVTIKRYTNRKLYDVAARRYVTLKEIAEAVRHGDDVRVVDYQNGEDLTTLTLLQVLLEEEKILGGFLPGRLLARFIQAGQSSLDGFRDAVNAFLDPTLFVDESIRTRIQALQQIGQIDEGQASELSRLLIDPKLRPSSPESGEHADVQALLDELDRISLSLDELNSR